MVHQKGFQRIVSRIYGEKKFGIGDMHEMISDNDKSLYFRVITIVTFHYTLTPWLTRIRFTRISLTRCFKKIPPNLLNTNLRLIPSLTRIFFYEQNFFDCQDRKLKFSKS